MIPLLPLLIAFSIVVSLGGPFIRLLRRIQAGQNVSQFLESHASKQGTPTMGGLLMLFAVAATALGFLATGQTPAMPAGSARNAGLLVGLMCAFAALGFLDDYVLPRLGQKKGLRWRPKLALQIAVAIPFVIAIPELASLPAVIGGIVFLVWWANVVNITDGLDGLASGTSAIALVGVLAIAPVAAYAESVVIAATVGAVLGFLWWNAPKARMFMGDTGSMMLGAAFGYFSLLNGLVGFAFLVGGLFTAEGLSVIVQLTSVKLRRGRRVFRSSPVHHHFEQLGWDEPTITVRFWLVGLLLALLAYGFATKRAWGIA